LATRRNPPVFSASSTTLDDAAFLIALEDAPRAPIRTSATPIIVPDLLLHIAVAVA
jgi:hypothetical protein